MQEWTSEMTKEAIQTVVWCRNLGFKQSANPTSPLHLAKPKGGLWEKAITLRYYKGWLWQ